MSWQSRDFVVIRRTVVIKWLWLTWSLRFSYLLLLQSHCRILLRNGLTLTPCLACCACHMLKSWNLWRFGLTVKMAGAGSIIIQVRPSESGNVAKSSSFFSASFILSFQIGGSARSALFAHKWKYHLSIPHFRLLAWDTQLINISMGALCWFRTTSASKFKSVSD